MTWLAQALHVARKDLRDEAWPLGAYLAVTALASAVVFTRAPGLASALAVLVGLLGMILAAAVVQSDSPTASDSFWGSRPFHPTAMAGAKVFLAAIVVLIPSIGQGLALSAFDVNSREAFVAIVDSSRTYVVWLLAAMAVASLTRNVRIFIVSFGTIFGAVMLADSIWYSLHSSLIGPDRQNPDTQTVGITGQNILFGGPRLWTAIAIGGAVALLVFLYSRRDARRRIWIAALAVVVSATGAAFTSEPPQGRPAGATSAADIPIRVELLGSDRLGKENRINLRVTGNAGSRRLLLYLEQVTIRLRDGTEVNAQGELGANSVVAAGNPFDGNVHWLRDETVPSFSLPLSFDQRTAIAKGVTGLELVGTMYVLEPRTLGMLPIESNRSLTRDGTRLEILSVTPAPDGGALSLQNTSAVAIQWSLPQNRLRGLYTQREYLLVNEPRSEVVWPQMTISTKSAALVLPGLPLVNETATLQMKAGTGIVRDAAWFSSARLALVEWSESGTYEVHAPIVEVPAPSRP